MRPSENPAGKLPVSPASVWFQAYLIILSKQSLPIHMYFILFGQQQSHFFYPFTPTESFHWIHLWLVITEQH